MPLSQSSSAPPSSEHWNVMSTGAVRLSVALKTKVAEVLVVVAPSASARSIAVSGASASGASIVHWYSTGSSTVVIPSSGSVVARTSNTCWPFVRPAYSCGDVQACHGVGTGSSTGSRRHSYVEPGWSKNSKVASGLVLSSSGATVTGVDRALVLQARRLRAVVGAREEELDVGPARVRRQPQEQDRLGRGRVRDRPLVQRGNELDARKHGRVRRRDLERVRVLVAREQARVLLRGGARQLGSAVERAEERGVRVARAERERRARGLGPRRRRLRNRHVGRHVGAARPLELVRREVGRPELGDGHDLEKVLAVGQVGVGGLAG